MGTDFHAADSSRPRRTSFGHEIPTRVDVPGWEAFGFHAANAEAFFDLLNASGARAVTGHLVDHMGGEITLPHARRLVMLARARFSTAAPEAIARAEEVWGFRATVGYDDLRHRLTEFGNFIEAAAAAGADLIRWG